jgi:hypothetical protein
MRRGQLQAMEPIIIVVILILIFSIAGVFFFRAGEREQATDARLLQDKNDAALLARMAWLPELSCGTGTNCIDRYKLEAFAALLHNQTVRTSYYQIFGQTQVSVTWIELEGQQQTVILYDNFKGEDVATTRTYFTIYDPATNTRNFAIMTIKRDA